MAATISLVAWPPSLRRNSLQDRRLLSSVVTKWSSLAPVSEGAAYQGRPTPRPVALLSLEMKVSWNCGAYVPFDHFTVMGHCIDGYAVSITPVRSSRFEFICLTGLPLLFVSPVVRNRVKYQYFRQKRMNTNPSRGPFHFKSPGRMVWRTIRGMIPHKTARGAEALSRLSTFEGIPHPYDKKKRQVVPAALRILRLKPGRDYTVMGDLAHSVGWKHRDLLKTLEEKRKVKADAFYQKKKARSELKAKAEAAVAGDVSAQNKVLESSGY
eukprot:CAMPEP_0113571758 /NCGR_PEP_ID=MMETSP0015_2-20120614/25730_1 /TAXON_ID=2838 /ORGANISM="Odontella" /LENGTH=267 /DNA_ID=CAMNT_0000474741 /DNA_START=110 /DNA_END=913 /DNA_ORIENTATION=+ /assembly_acc=CAM_ASM_000160